MGASSRVGEDRSSALTADNLCLSPRPSTGSGLMGENLSPTVKNQAWGGVLRTWRLISFRVCYLLSKAFSNRGLPDSLASAVTP